MENQAAVVIATKTKEAMAKMEEVIDYMHQNVKPAERAPIVRAIGQIFAIASDEIYSRLVKVNPELHERLFRGHPTNAPDNLLRMSKVDNSGD